jgi:ribosomal protein S18 acetylase RimI-like enzyme
VSVSALDRPVWNALTGRQADLAVGSPAAWRIDPGYGPFAAARPNAPEALAGLLRDGDDVIWLVEPQEWAAPVGTRLVRTAHVLQMVADATGADYESDPAIVALGPDDVPEMAALAHATAPGPWGPSTQHYGSFFGIKDHGRLIAMAGERLRPAPGLGEVSGVCTDPAWRGRGLAPRLIRAVMAGLRARGDTPFLHSYSGNAAAIRLYESLGFRARAELTVTVLAKA